MTPQPPNTHRVVIEFDDGVYFTKLIHPESGCQPATTCADCGRDITDPESTPCDVCKDGLGDSKCWVEGWFEAGDSDVLQGRVELEVEPEWTGDSMIAHITSAGLPAKVSDVHVEFLSIDQCVGWFAGGSPLREYLDEAIETHTSGFAGADRETRELANYRGAVLRLVRRAVFGEDVPEPPEGLATEWARMRFWPHVYTSRMSDGRWIVRVGRLELWGDEERSQVNVWLQRWSRRHQSRYLWLRLRVHITPERVYWP